MDVLAFNQLSGRARSGETEAVLEACRQHQGLVHRATMSGDRLLHFACKGGNLELARGLLDLGAVVDARTDGGWDALMCASRDGQKGHAAIVTLLLDRGADPCSRNAYATALCIAAMYDHLQVCLILLNRGADLMAVCDEGCTALTHYGSKTFQHYNKKTNEQLCQKLREAWAAGPHPSQRWARRWP